MGEPLTGKFTRVDQIWEGANLQSQTNLADTENAELLSCPPFFSNIP